jgi:hypothetical protein
MSRITIVVAGGVTVAFASEVVDGQELMLVDQIVCHGGGEVHCTDERKAAALSREGAGTGTVGVADTTMSRVHLDLFGELEETFVTKNTRDT